MKIFRRIASQYESSCAPFLVANTHKKQFTDVLDIEIETIWPTFPFLVDQMWNVASFWDIYYCAQIYM